LGTAEATPSRKRALLIGLKRRLRKPNVTAICFTTNSKQRPVSIRDSTGNEPHNKSDSRFVG
jgi:hypothetical protein